MQFFLSANRDEFPREGARAAMNSLEEPGKSARGRSAPYTFAFKGALDFMSGNRLHDEVLR